jgi:hypothetical protein
MRRPYSDSPITDSRAFDKRRRRPGLSIWALSPWVLPYVQWLPDHSDVAVSRGKFVSRPKRLPQERERQRVNPIARLTDRAVGR